MEKNEKMVLWGKLVKQVKDGIASMSTDQEVADALTVGLPMILTTIEQGFCEEVQQESKELLILMVDALEKNGMKVKEGSPVKAMYDEYKAELTPSKVNSPLPSIFENLTLATILNAPLPTDLPKHGYLGN